MLEMLLPEAAYSIEDDRILALHRGNGDLRRDRDRRLRLLAKFVVAARRELVPDERQEFATVARKGVAEAIRRIDDRALRSTKAACSGCRYWSEAAIHSALQGKRIFGEHSPECSHLADYIWRSELSTDGVYRILSKGEVIALTKEEQKFVGHAHRDREPQVFDSFGAGISTIYCLSGSSPQRVAIARV